MLRLLPVSPLLSSGKSPWLINPVTIRQRSPRRPPQQRRCHYPSLQADRDKMPLTKQPLPQAMAVPVALPAAARANVVILLSNDSHPVVQRRDIHRRGQSARV